MNPILRNESFKRFATGLILGFCFFGAYFHSMLLFSLILFALLFIILFFEWPKLIDLSIYNLKFWIISFFYPIIPVSTLIYLNQCYRNSDFLLPLYPFFVSWSADTGAYILGKSFGKHKICPTISPGKSWEGLFGGFLSVVVLNIFILPAILTFPFTLYLRSFIPVFIYSILITLIAFFGDIFISFLKRKRGLKDTGNLLPGHGGLLDRFDSVLFVASLLFLIIFFNKLL